MVENVISLNIFFSSENGNSESKKTTNACNSKKTFIHTLMNEKSWGVHKVRPRVQPSLWRIYQDFPDYLLIFILFYFIYLWGIANDNKMKSSEQ